MVTRLKPLLVPGLAWLAMHEGEAVGFLLALPDFNTALQPLGGRLLSPGLLRALPYILGWKRPPIMRLVALGVQREFRGQGIEAAMIAETLTACRREGFIECEASWVLEENTAVQRVIGLFGGRAYKTYRLYERAV
jgi:GNAT superfamily N-acetyltransferase